MWDSRVQRVAWAILLACGCGETVTVNPAAAGTAGESCESSAHCAQGLRCIDRRCVIVTGEPGASDAGIALVRGVAGETCKRRADCGLGLGCIDRRCVDLERTVAPTANLGLGQRLESCVARNDCVEGLACIAGVCIEANYVLSMADKECLVVECQQFGDCCDSFVTLVPQADCNNYAARCADGTPSADLYCAAFRTNCECRRVCEEQRCVSDLTCTDDTECGANGVLACHGGRCLQCASDAECGNGEICQNNSCSPGCDRDENCGAFSKCERGRCTESACASDRDCQFATDNLRSVCVDELCDTPCEADRECPTFQVCIDASCVFIGCESDAECRVHLELHNLGPGAISRAVCIAPTD